MKTFTASAAAAIAAAALTLMMVPAQSGSDADLGAAIDAVKSASERFRDVKVALAEGYVADPGNHCVTAAAEGLPAELGGMGIHYLHPELLQLTATEPRVDGNGTHTDFEKPAILIYEPAADGSLVLVGVENLVFKNAWETAGNTEPPVFAGRKWDLMEDNPDTASDEAHGFAPHYDQHVYLMDDDLTAAVQPFHRSVTCEHHKDH
ncbi:hypothetical protein [Nitratireductor luteus]|uniref:hypothetical protein n=1 Tax=Nitratireductor luteus TaxID=2976980 RepID=UPI00223FC814|nr:hypothetical protein [Nitratireductor luteus]